MGGEQRRRCLVGIKGSAKIYDRRLVGGRHGPGRPFPGALDADPIRSAVSIGPGPYASSGVVVRTWPAMKGCLRSPPTGMGATLLVLNQEFEFFGRDSVSVLWVLFDDGLAAGPRLLWPLVR